MNSTNRSPITPRSLLRSCASIAIAAGALAAQQAHAQAFSGSPTTVTGTVGYARSTPGVETITIGSPTASINWVPTNNSGTGNINFLPSGNVATYQGGEGLTDFTVLNRIVPTDPSRLVEFNGSVLSRLAGGATGGRVWFYSPGGILVGATASFDVGGLLLTSLDATSFNANGGTFTAATASPGTIRIENNAQVNNAQVNATAPGSYVAIIAPRIEQAGNIQVNGSAAYVAANNVTMSINQGLFDIQVGEGTGDINGIVHSGTTGGAASSGDGDIHRIYMVAVPKNQALTMLLTGSVGFDEASVAGVQNGAIVLSSGFGIDNNAFGSDDPTNDHLGGAGVVNNSSIAIGHGTFSSSVEATASGSIYASGGGSTLDFFHDVDLQAFGTSSLLAMSGEKVTVGGNLMVSADDVRNFSVANPDVLLPLNAQAGTAQIAAAGGSLTVNGDAVVSADAMGGENSILGTVGTANGGHSGLYAYGGGELHVTGNTWLTAQGLQRTGGAVAGSDSHGGYATVSSSGTGGMTVDGHLELNVIGRGTVNTSAGGQSGSGFGGQALVETADQGELHIGGRLFAYADGFGGAMALNGTTAGDGFGGNISMLMEAGTSVSIALRILFEADGLGGNAVAGGDGTGGIITFVDSSSAPLSLTNLQMESIGFGGTGTTGAGGDGHGGTTNMAVNTGASIVSPSVYLFAYGIGGNSQSGAGGNATGGSTTTSINGTGVITASSGFDAFADAGGGSSTSGTGGNATAGTASLLLDGGSLTATQIAVTADAFGGNGATGGNATGGTSNVTMSANGGHLTTSQDFELHSWGNYNGTGAGTVQGGDATGGTVNLNIANTLNSGAVGVVSFSNAMIDTSGRAGSGPAMGHGAGGTTNVNFGAATTTISGATTINANGSGNGPTGGTATVNILPAGPVSFADLAISAEGTGGSVAVNGDIASSGYVDLDSGGTIDFDNVSANRLSFAAGGAVTGGNVAFQSRMNGEADGAVVLGNLTGSGLPPVDEFSIGISSGTSIAAGNISAPGPVGFASAGNLTTGTIAAGPLIMAMVGGDLTTGSLTTANDGRIYLADASMFATGGGGGEGDFDPSIVLALDPVATGGSIHVNGPITTGRLQANAGDDLVIGNASVGGSIDLTAGGDLSTGVVTAGGTVHFNAAGAIAADDLSAATASVFINAGLGFLVNDVTAANAQLTAGGTAAFNGTVAVPTIMVHSADLDVRTGARLGTSVTDTLTLNAVTSGPAILIGELPSGVSATGHYHLGDEGGDIQADSIIFNAIHSGESGNADIVIYNANIDGSLAADGGVHSLAINTPDSIRVEGNVLLGNADTDDSLMLSAGDRLEVLTPGGIRMNSPTGGLAGILTLRGDSIVVTSPTLASQLAADSNFAGRDDALRTNSGPVNAAGYLQAGGIRLIGGHNIFIQNTGTATEFAGLTVGGDGLLIGNYSTVPGTGGTQSFSFSGTLITANDVLQFNFTVDAESTVTLRTYSYAGGTNAAGEVIASGGFDPILALFDAAGLRIAENDDGGSLHVPADPTTGDYYDTFLQSVLQPGEYTVTVMAYSNFSIGPNLSNGFENDGNFNGRSPNFAFDVLGAATATGPGQGADISVVAFGRQQNSDGTFTTNQAFFNQLDYDDHPSFGFVQGSTFNNCVIGGGTCSAPPPPPPPVIEPTPPPVEEPAPAVPPEAVGSDSVLGPIGESSTEMAIAEPEKAAEDQDDDDSDEEGGKKTTNVGASLGLINSSQVELNQDIDTPVTSGSDIVIGEPGGAN